MYVLFFFSFFFQYLAGFSAKIHRHHIHAGTEFKPDLTTAYLKTVTHTESVMLKPPASALEQIDVEERENWGGGGLIKMRQSNKTYTETPTTTTGLPEETAQLVITAPIAIGATRGAQIVACTVTPCPVDGSSETPTSFQAAVKIFDPLYYDFELYSNWPRDCIFEADQDDYRTEAAAYEHLEAQDPEHKDSFMPEYYGSWTMTPPICATCLDQAAQRY